nr:MAG: ORF1 [TTV-like mini virus]
MPWYNYYRRNRWRRRRPWYRRPRKTFRRRWHRRRYWVRRRFNNYKRKLKKLKLTEWQPKSIRKCKCKGFLCLFQTTENRLSYNFDMYEESFVPERLPGGGGFSIKNLSLNSLYIEHTMGHNIFTQSNNHYPLMRYSGCKIKFYQSEKIDYVCTYSNSWPLISNMQMYNTMQPSIHLQLKHKVIVPSKLTQKRRKPYIIKFIPPPTQMKNQWYFQKNLSKVPLLMLRTTATTLDHFYIGNRMKSTNITITSLNTSIIQNRDMGNRNRTWSCRTLGTVQYFLYGTTEEKHDIAAKTKLENITMLTNTQDYKPGITLVDTRDTTNKTNFQKHFTNKNLIGNPFHSNYLLRHDNVILSNKSPQEISLWVNENDINSSTTLQNITNSTWEYIDITRDIRYNPYKDNGKNNTAYFLPIGPTGTHGWENTTKEELTNRNLPLWILLFGYPDFIKKTSEIHNIDTNQILVITTTKASVTTLPAIVPLSYTFEHGTSPYLPIDEHPQPDTADLTRWYPQYQYQQETINEICLSGPGTPKIPQGETTEAKIKYCFYFKWGGDLPPMSSIEDFTEKPVYPVPNNFTSTTSLQNPETFPQTYLYSFDERRGELTKTATERITKDYEIKEMPFLSTGPRFAETSFPQKTQEDSSSEEEEENLYQLLQHQRNKQQLLKQRILRTLKRIQNLE